MNSNVQVTCCNAFDGLLVLGTDQGELLIYQQLEVNMSLTFGPVSVILVFIPFIPFIFFNLSVILAHTPWGKSGGVLGFFCSLSPVLHLW